MQTLDHVALQAEYELILKVMVEVDFNKKRAAEKLGIDRKTLYNKLEKIKNTPGIKKPKITVSA